MHKMNAGFDGRRIWFKIKMNAGFDDPRFSPAEWLLERPKSHQKAAGTYGFRSSLYSSRVLECLHHPWSFDWQLYEASDDNRRFSSSKRGGAPPSSLKSGILWMIRSKISFTHDANLILKKAEKAYVLVV